MNLQSLRMLLPEEAVVLSEPLLDHIREFGMQAPLIVIDQLVVDGHKRLLAARHLGLTDVPVYETHGIPALAFWQANVSRSWTSLETALLFQLVPDKHRMALGESLHLGDSPHMQKALAFMADQRAFWNDFKMNLLPLAVMRDLAHLETRMGEFFLKITALEASAAEKRILAGLLKQCVARKSLPDWPDGIGFAELKQRFEQIVQPRKKEAWDKVERFMKEVPPPKGSKVEVDPTFERPGALIQLRIKARDLKKLDDLKSWLTRLFESVEELT